MLCWARPVSITSGPGFQTVDSLPKTQFRETNPHVRPFHASSSSRNHRNSWPASPYPSWAPEGPSSTQSFTARCSDASQGRRLVLFHLPGIRSGGSSERPSLPCPHHLLSKLPAYFLPGTDHHCDYSICLLPISSQKPSLSYSLLCL